MHTALHAPDRCVLTPRCSPLPRMQIYNCDKLRLLLVGPQVGAARRQPAAAAAAAAA